MILLKSVNILDAMHLHQSAFFWIDILFLN